MNTSLALPTIHLNGTGPDTLMDSYDTASLALSDAALALRRVELNARDYYVQGPDAFRRAQEEHAARLDRLDAIRAEIIAITEHIDATRPPRRTATPV